MSAPLTLEAIVTFAQNLPGFCCFDSADGQTVVTWSRAQPHTAVEGWEAFIRDNTRQPPTDDSQYSGGVVGWLGYEAGRSVETMPAPTHARPTHDICLWRTDGAIVVDSSAGTTSVHGAPDFRAEAQALITQARKWTPKQEPTSTAAPWHPENHDEREDRYTQGVERILSHVHVGDVYQVNLAWEQGSITVKDAASAWLRLRRQNPAARGCYLRQGTIEIISNSPELFLSVDPVQRRVLSMPIKGTAAIAEGRHAKRDLEVSPKERAELTMIVDLVRNDLGRVAQPGSVKTEPRVLRQCGDLWHAEQQVSAVLADGNDAVSAVAAAFPPGSVTGAPKVRAMEVIHTLESRPRGVYTGAIGWFADGGGAHLNVAIRTATVVDGVGRFHVGAGIVADSQPQREWRETLAKARALVHCLST